MRSHVIVLIAAVLFISGCLQGQECPQDAKPVCGSDGVTYKNACLAAKANVTIKSQGACPAAACVDSDGGKDIFTSGSVSEGGSESRDMCAGPSSVLERFCTGSAALSENLPCPAGYQCDAGRCVSAPCTDSDGGINEDTKGSVTSGDKTMSDECANAGSVKEYYCESGNPNSKDINCGAGMGCVNGACVKTLCTDSDGGKDPAVKGTAKSGSDSQTDSCDGNSLTEYFCEADQVKSEKGQCPGGTSCSDGKCVKNVCVDSDNGKDADVKGTTSYGSTVYTDSCYSDTSVLEYFCANENTIGNDPMNCGTSRECFDGKCRNVECAVNLTSVDDKDVRHEVQEFDDSDELTIYEGQVVEIMDGMFLELYSVSGNQSTFRLYLTYDDMIDGDEECSVDIDEGNSENDLCGENTGDVDVNTVDDTDNFAEINLQEYYAVQYYTQDGTIKDWTDKSQCADDEESFDSFVADFYPYLDTESGGLNLDGKKFKLFSVDAEIVDIDTATSTITIDVDGDELELQDGDDFEYRGENYEVISMVFNDGGLAKLEIELS
jgi:hypothetical protein